jgi:SUKH-4 immunity protein
MRIQAEPFDYSVPTWRPYDAGRLAELGAPTAAVAALAGRGLPEDAYEHFVRVPERELERGVLPGCGDAAFLGHAWDGFNNTYWLSLTDGSVWMRYGQHDEPLHHVKRINSSVEALQSVLVAYLAFALPWSGRMLGTEEHEKLISQSVIHAVAADPTVFEDEENWWSLTFQEVEFSSARILLGDRSLFELVNRDEGGHWALDHPGYEDGDEGGDGDGGGGWG